MSLVKNLNNLKRTCSNPCENACKTSLRRPQASFSYKNHTCCSSIENTLSQVYGPSEVFFVDGPLNVDFYMSSFGSIGHSGGDLNLEFQLTSDGQTQIEINIFKDGIVIDLVPFILNSGSNTFTYNLPGAQIGQYYFLITNFGISSLDLSDFENLANWTDINPLGAAASIVPIAGGIAYTAGAGGLGNEVEFVQFNYPHSYGFGASFSTNRGLRIIDIANNNSNLLNNSTTINSSWGPIGPIFTFRRISGTSPAGTVVNIQFFNLYLQTVNITNGKVIKI